LFVFKFLIPHLVLVVGQFGRQLSRLHPGSTEELQSLQVSTGDGMPFHHLRLSRLERLVLGFKDASGHPVSSQSRCVYESA
jgi:hypothetical protein